MKPPRDWIQRRYDEAARESCEFDRSFQLARELYTLETGRPAPKYGAFLLSGTESE